MKLEHRMYVAYAIAAGLGLPAALGLHRQTSWSFQLCLSLSLFAVFSAQLALATLIWRRRTPIGTASMLVALVLLVSGVEVDASAASSGPTLWTLVPVVSLAASWLVWVCELGHR